jgi:hypothetical protein
MKRILTFSILGSLNLLVAASTASSAPLRRADVIADPVWVLHVDADGLRSTTVGKYIFSELTKPEAQAKLAAFQAIFNFDPAKNVHGVTLYSATKAQADGVLLINADFDADRLKVLAEAAKEHSATNHGSCTIHSWYDDKRSVTNGAKPRVYAAIHGKTVIFGQKEARVAEALDVLDGTKANLSASPQFAKLDQSSAFVQGAARKPELPGSEPNSAVLKQSNMATLLVSESQGNAQANLILDTDTADVAKQLEAVGKGLLGLMALQKEKPDSPKLVQFLSVKSDGPSVTIHLAMPANDAVEMIKADQARKAAAKSE